MRTLIVNVIVRHVLVEAAKKHPETLRSISAWYKIDRKAEWNGLHEVRQTFPSADQVGRVIIFNIPGGITG